MSKDYYSYGVYSKLKDCKYTNHKKAEEDVKRTITNYKNLRPLVEKYTFDNGQVKDLLCLDGTIPVLYRGTYYHIPVKIWLLPSHPNEPPICYVNPTQDMAIRPSRQVSASGRVFTPYLSNWRPDTCDLLGVIQVMIINFGDAMPVFTKPKTATPVQPPPVPPPPATSTPGGGSYPPYPSIGGTQPPYPSIGGVQPPYPVPGGGGPPYPGAHGNPPYPSAMPPYPVASSASATSANPLSNGTGTITSEHIRASLLSAVEDKIRRRARDLISIRDDEISVLRQASEDLNRGKRTLEEMIDQMERESVACTEARQALEAKDSQLADLIVKNEQGERNIDEAFGPTAPLYKQLCDAYAEENAIVDAVYYLGEGLRKGVLELEVFLKSVRELSRKQFMLRALMQKCRERAGLPL